jgi:CRISPR-associated protein Cmr1
LRPLACKDGAVGLALILDGTSVAHLPEGLRLHCDRRSYKVHALLSQEEAKQVEPLYGNPDVLEAFLEHLKKEEKR